jgi:protein tyrosine phosphatase
VLTLLSSLSCAPLTRWSFFSCAPQREHNDPQSSYINANYVPNFHGQNTWIAAQGPTPRTLPSFVRMLWEQNVTTVVMLTKLKEGAKSKCEPYVLRSPLALNKRQRGVDECT